MTELNALVPLLTVPTAAALLGLIVVTVATTWIARGALHGSTAGERAEILRALAELVRALAGRA